MKTSTIFSRILGALFFIGLCGGTAGATVTVNKVFNPIAVNVGDTSTVTVTLQNGDTTTGVVIASASDDIASMGGKGKLNTALGSLSNTCGGVVTTDGVSIVTLTGGTIPIATDSTHPGTCTFTFQVFGNQAGNGQNAINGANVITSGGAVSSIQQTLQVNAVNATVAVTPSVTVPISTPTTETFTITNPAANVALVNSTPGAALFTIDPSSAQAYSITGATNTCGSATTTVFPQTTNTAIGFTGGSIPAGGSCTVTLTVNSAVDGAVVNLSLPAGGIVDDSGVTNSSAAATQVKFSDGRPNLGKGFNPTNIQPTGQGPAGADTSQLTVTIQNVLSTVALTNVALTDPLPAGVVIKDTTVAANTCGGTITPVAGATSVSIANGVVPFNAAGNAFCQFIVDVTAAVPGVYINTIPAANFSGNAGAVALMSAFNSPSAGLNTTNTGGSVSAGKAFSTGSVGLNTPVQVTLSFGSVAQGAFNSGTFTDALPQTAPAMIAYVDPTHQSATAGCGGAPVITDVNGATTVSGSGLTITAGATCYVSFWVIFPNVTSQVRTATNTATGSFIANLGGATVNTTASSTISELPTLTVQNYLASNQGLINQTQTVQGAIQDPSGTTDTNAIGVFNLSPGSVRLAAVPNFQLSGCPNGTTVTPDASNNFFTVNAGTINATCTISYNVIDVGGAQGTFTPSASSYSGALTGNTPIAATGTNNVTFSSSNINITKAFVPNNIHAGGVATTHIGLTVQGVFPNPQHTEADGVTFPDTLPANMTFAPAPNVNFSGCQQTGQPAPAYVISGSTITVSNVSLLTVGATATTCTVAFDVTSDVLGSPTNAIAAGAVTSTSGVTNSQPVSASLTVLSGVEVQKTFVAPSVAIGSSVYIRFLITNTQTSSILTDGALTDTMPSSLAVASTTLGPRQAGDPPSCAGAMTTGAVGSSNFTLTGLIVPAYVAPVPGQCVAYVLVGASQTAAANTVATNSIPAAGLTFTAEHITNINPTTANSTLTPAPNVALAKAFLPATIAAGATSVLTISIINTAPSAAYLSNLTLSDTLPAGVSIAATPNGSTTCGAGAVAAVAGGSSVALSGGTVAANATCTIAVGVTGSTGGIYTNTIAASNVTSLQGATNAAPASGVLNIGNVSGVTLAKSFAPALIAANGTSLLTIAINNTMTGAVALSAVQLNDPLPANVVVAAVPNAATTCAAGTVSANPGAVTVGLAGANIPAGTSCTFSMSVTSATSGIYVNTIPANTLADAQSSTNAAPAQATLNVGNASGVGLAKSFTPQAIAANGISLLTISIVNNAPSAVALSALALTDTLPANVRIATVPNAATSCGAGVVTALAGAVAVSLSGGSLAANATCTITVSVTSALAGVYTNTIAANAITDAQASTNTLPAMAILNVANASGVALSKAFAPAVIAPGATSVLTITLGNTQANAVPLSALTLNDNLPANVTIAPAPNASTTCTGGTVGAVAGGTVVTLAGVSMAINNTCTVTLTVTGSIPNTYTNTIPAGAITTTQGATNATPAQANLIIGQPALLVTKTSIPSAASVSPGQPIVYAIVMKNNGTQAETNAHLGDVLTNATLVPGSVTINNAAAADQIVSAGQSFGSIAVGATITIAYTATVNLAAPAGATVTNTATIAGDQPCAIGSCIAASPLNTVSPPVLSAVKLIDGVASEPVVAGQTVTYAITVSNTGTSPAVNTVITDPLPASVTFVTGSVALNGTSLPAASISGQTLTIPISQLNAGASAVVTFGAKIGPAAGNAPNTVSVLAAGLSRAVQSSTAMAHQVPATLTVVKTASATTVTVGDRVDYQIVVAPVGGVTYGKTVFIDTLPSGETYAPGTSRVNGKPMEPAIAGHTLTWTLPALGLQATITYSTVIAPGVQQNTQLTNVVTVTAVAPGGAGLGSGSGSASVLVVQTTFGSCYPITGRVYLDARGSGRFEDPDVGLGGVNIYLDNGENVTTDHFGRYDFPCVHPGMHALRLDETTLPPGAVPYDDRNIDHEKSTRRLVHHIYDTTIIEDINFAITGTLKTPPAPFGIPPGVPGAPVPPRP